MHLFLGVDIAGTTNTWVTALTLENGKPQVALDPCRMTLVEIRDTCEQHDVLAVAIDAQLTVALEHERGFRPSDEALRERLPAEYRNWVASFNSLMAVPVRGQLLARELSPLVGTILETHPRACLYGVLGEGERTLIERYKGREASAAGGAALWGLWCDRFGIHSDVEPTHDGAVDALVCATVALAYHREPERLLHLRNPAVGLSGWGPFYMFAGAER